MADYDLVVIGAGPAGMAATVAASAAGLTVAILDEQPAPGGQTWRNVEGQADTALAESLGDAYRQGLDMVAAFRRAPVDYLPDSQMWHCEEHEGGFRLFYTRHGNAKSVTAKQVLLATGAQERPAPFEGWTLPGVMTVGAAQILLKTSGQIPEGKLWVAGSGPLVLLYLVQLLEAGGQVAGVINTAPDLPLRQTMRLALQAAPRIGKMMQGLGWQRYLKRHGVRMIAGGHVLRAEGDGRLQALTFQDAEGRAHDVPADMLLVHQGVLPSIHVPLALNCAMVWHEAGQYFMPDLDEWGASSIDGLFIAGDGAGIAGAEAAVARGTIAGIGIAMRLGRVDDRAARARIAPARRTLSREMALRPLIDTLYPPHPSILAPSDDTIICRCEEITAGQIRALARLGDPDPNQMKAFTRCGMGPCQGRQCGYTVSNILAQEQARPVSEVGFYRVRPPLKPVSLAELANLETEEGGQ